MKFFRNMDEMELHLSLNAIRVAWFFTVMALFIWGIWEDFAKVMKGPYFKLDQVIGGRFPMKDFEAALAQIHSGVPGKMILYP